MDKKAEYQAYCDWAFKKEGEAIGRMDGNDAVWAGWEARALLSASIADTAGAKPVGYMMKHKAGMDIGFAWKPDGPQFSNDWIRVPLYAAPPAPSVADASARTLVHQIAALEPLKHTDNMENAVRILSCALASVPSVADAAGAKVREISDAQLQDLYDRAQVEEFDGWKDSASVYFAKESGND